ncbi:hypothetical protein C8N39_11223 [Dietzia psychralcaliphila]|nr:hypothetical protein C8N39_11223 [Dietzia psychralcaliphila]
MFRSRRSHAAGDCDTELEHRRLASLVHGESVGVFYHTAARCLR